MSDSLPSHGLQHPRLLCPPLSSGVCSNSCSLMHGHEWIESVMLSNHLILCHSLLLLPSIFPRIPFSNKYALRIRWPKYWSFTFSISPFNEHPGLISFRMDSLSLYEITMTLSQIEKILRVLLKTIKSNKNFNKIAGYKIGIQKSIVSLY